MTLPHHARALALVLTLAAASAPPAFATGATPPQRDIPREIVKVARGEFDKGVREVPRGSNNSARIATYRGAMVPRARPAAWCAYFASWVARRSGAPIGRHGAGIASAAGIAAWARTTGRWARYPRPGDLAVYRGHVGVVVKVSGAHMTTIEGNWSDRVSRLYRHRSAALGFARLAVGARLTGRRR